MLLGYMRREVRERRRVVGELNLNRCLILSSTASHEVTMNAVPAGPYGKSRIKVSICKAYKEQKNAI
jgi:hypothetical protein